MTPSENLPAGPAGPAGPTTALQLRQQSYMLQTGLARPDVVEEADDSLSVKDVLQVLAKHKWSLMAGMLL